MYNDHNEFDREAPDGTWRDQRHDQRRDEGPCQAREDERAPRPQEDEAGAPRHNGRFRKGVCANPYGRAGNPAKRAKRRVAREEPFEAVLLKELLREVPVLEGGRQNTLPLYQLIIRKFVHDLMTAPIKVQAELLIGRRSFLRELLERVGDHRESDGAWTDELEDAYQAMVKRHALYDEAVVAGDDVPSDFQGDDRNINNER